MSSTNTSYQISDVPGMHSNLFSNPFETIVRYNIMYLNIESSSFNVDFKGLFFGVHEKRGCIVSHLVAKLKASVPPPGYACPLHHV